MSTDQATCLLAFSGGLDTSYCILHLRERGFRVITACVNTGGFDAAELARIASASQQLGAVAHHTIEAQATLWQDYLRFLLFGNVLRGQMYPLSVSAERVCQAKCIADVALQVGASAICHGSTGAGNDQVRFDVAFRTLVSGVQIITPVRELALSREFELAELAKVGFELPARASTYSVNAGLWGTSVGGKETHDSWQHLPESAYPAGKIAPEQTPVTIELGFAQGEPCAINGVALDPVALVHQLNQLGSSFGIGRGIHLGDTILGIKGRVGFEAPGAAILIAAHRELEKLVLSGKQLQFKEGLSQSYGNILHEGHYFDPLGRDLESFLISSQSRVSGDVRLVLRPYSVEVQGVRSVFSLMQSKVASYGEGAKAWSGAEAAGFAKIYGIAQQISYAHAATGKMATAQPSNSTPNSVKAAS
jgi:argininosuccinate synthase